MPYDCYEISAYFKKGANRIAVLNIFFGESNFSYRLYRQGLIFSLECGDTLICSDQNTLTCPYYPYSANTPKMCVQMGRSEQIDATMPEISFFKENFDSSRFVPATVIDCEDLLWNLDFHRYEYPPLNEKEVWPLCVSSLCSVETLSFTRVLGVRECLYSNLSDCGNVALSAMVGFKLEVPEDCRLDLHTSVFSPIPVYIDGVFYPSPNGGTRAQPMFVANLKAGVHTILFEYARVDFYCGIHFGINCTTDFEIKPFLEGFAGEFALIGPFVNPLPVEVFEPPGGYTYYTEDHAQVVEALKADNLPAVADLISEFPARYVYRNDVFMENTVLLNSTAYSVGHELQNCVFSNQRPTAVPALPGDTRLIFDFGREVSGFFSFEIEADAGTIFDFNFFEYMKADQVQYTWGHDMTLRYKAAGGRQSYTSFQRRGFRYVSLIVRGRADGARIYRISAIQSSFPMADLSAFWCPDERLNGIYEISKNTILLCAEDTFVDCPAYEQALWLDDFRVEALVSQYTHNAAGLVRRCLDLICSSKVQNPLVPSQLPSGWKSVITNFSFSAFRAFYNHYMHTGDAKTLKKGIALFDQAAERYIQHVGDDGLFRFYAWKLIDWAAMDTPYGDVVTCETAGLYGLLRNLDDAAAQINYRQPKYKELCQRIKEAVFDKLWNDERGAFTDCLHGGKQSTVFSIQTQLSVLQSGMLEGSDKFEKCSRVIIERPEGFLDFASPLMFCDLFDFYEKMGQKRKICDDILRYYSQMLEEGSSSLWEMYPNSQFHRFADFYPSRSYCHGFGAAPLCICRVWCWVFYRTTVGGPSELRRRSNCLTARTAKFHIRMAG